MSQSESDTLSGGFAELSTNRAARIFELAVDLFGGDREAARQRLQTPKRALGDATPLGHSATAVGAREVEDLLGRAEQGVFS